MKISPNIFLNEPTESLDLIEAEQIKKSLDAIKKRPNGNHKVLKMSTKKWLTTEVGFVNN